MMRDVILTVVGSLCTPFGTPDGAGFLCTRGPRPITDVLDCGHVKVSYNGRRPQRKCDECHDDDLYRKAMVSKAGDRLIILEERLGGRWRVTVNTTVVDDNDGLWREGHEAAMRAYANDVWSGRETVILETVDL